MHHHYRDITDKLGQPLWWDEYAVPRYCEFNPNEVADIYASEVCLLEIGCQNCGQGFKVAMSWSYMDRVIRDSRSLSELIAINAIHYGDPPNNGCCPAGPTMNSIPIQVIEFWQKNRLERERKPELERGITPEWAEEEGV